MAKLTKVVDGQHLLGRFRLTRVARKVVGAGSVGLRRREPVRQPGQAVADFEVSYADQTERNHAALAEAAASGRVEAKTGV